MHIRITFLISLAFALWLSPVFAQGRGGAPPQAPTAQTAPASDSTPRVETYGISDDKTSLNRGRCRRRARRVRPVEQRPAGAVHGAVPGLRQERAEMGIRSPLSDRGQRAAVELGRVHEQLHGHDRALRSVMSHNAFLRILVAQ